MNATGIYRINKELDALTAPGRQALNAVIRCSYDRTVYEDFSVVRTRKYRGSASITLTCVLSETSSISLYSLDSSTADLFSAISVGDLVTGEGISDNSVVTSKDSTSIKLNTPVLVTSSMSEVIFTPPVVDNDLYLRGAEDIKLSLNKWMFPVLHDFFEKWGIGEYTSETFDELIIEDNFGDNSVNTTLPYGKTPVIGTTVDGVKNVFITPTTRALVAFSKIINGTFDSLATQITDGTSYAVTMDESDSSSFISSDNISTFSGNFVDDSVGYWLHLIRNSANHRITANSSPIPLNMPALWLNKTLGLSEYNINSPYMLSPEYHNHDHLGCHGDSVNREGGGYSWDIVTSHLGIGIANQGEGKYAAVIGNYSIAAGTMSSAFNYNTQAIDINASSFGKYTIAGEMPYVFVNGAYDSTLETKTSCIDCVEVVSLCGDVDIGDGDLTVSIDSRGLGFVIGDSVLIYNALDVDNNVITESVLGTVASTPVEIEKRDGSGYKTLMQIAYNDDIISTIGNGWISRQWNGISANKSRFVMGEYNKPNRYAIFQIGNGNDIFDGRSTAAEIGFDNGLWTGRYFRFGSDGVGDDLYVHDHMYISQYHNVFSVGEESKNYISMFADSLEVNEGISGSGIIDFRDGISNIKAWDSSVSMRISNSDSAIYTDGGISSFIVNSSSIGLNTRSIILFSVTEGEISLESTGMMRIYPTSRLKLSSPYVYTILSDMTISTKSYIVIAETLKCTVHDLMEIEISNWFTVSGGTLSISSNLYITTDNPVIFSHSCTSGYSHSNSANINTTSGAGGIVDVNTAGFHSVTAGAFSSIIDDSFLTGTSYNLTPDTSKYDKKNSCINSVYNDDWKWVMGMTSYGTSDPRLWSMSCAEGTWEPWRSFTYHEDVESAGYGYSYLNKLVSFPSHTSGETSEFVGVTGDDIADGVIEATLVDSPSATIGSAEGITGYAPMTSGSAAMVRRMIFSKIGYLVTFWIKIYIGDSNLVDAGDDHGIVLILNGGCSELTPAKYDNEGIYKSYKFIATADDSSIGSIFHQHHNLTIRKYRTIGTSFAITTLDRNHDIEIDDLGYIEFSGQYYSENNEPISIN